MVDRQLKTVSFSGADYVLGSLKIFFLERKFKNGKLDVFAILILTFALPFCLIGLVVSWKEFLNFFVYFVSDYFCLVLFLFFCI